MSTSSSPSDNPSTAPVGVHIEAIRLVAEKARKMAEEEGRTMASGIGLTTTEVCDKIVKPETAELQCAYIDLLKEMTASEQAIPMVAPATVFVSHAWRYDFGTPLSVLEDFHDQTMAKDGAGSPPYFWFDLFTNNQHKAADLPQEWWSTTFKDNIAQIGQVILVTSPWNAPVPLSRAWCLWEIICSLSQPVEFMLRLPASQVEQFKDALLQSTQAGVSAITDLRAEKAEAFLKHDKEMIFKTIEDTVTFDVLNSTVKEQLRTWYKSTARRLADELVEEAKQSATDKHDMSVVAVRGKTLVALGSLFAEFGDGDQSLELQQQGMDMLKSIAQPDQDIIRAMVTTMSNMCGTLLGKRKLDEAEELISKALELVERHPEATFGKAGNVYNCAAMMAIQKGQFQEAIRQAKTAVEYHQEHLNSMPSDGVGANGQPGPGSSGRAWVKQQLGMAYGNLAVAYSRLEQRQQAIAAIRQTYEIGAEVHGNAHPQVAMALNTLGVELMHADEYQEAVEKLTQARDIATQAYGASHNLLSIIDNNLGAAYLEWEKYAQAVEPLKRSYDLKNKLLDAHDVDRARTLMSLTRAYHKLGQSDDAAHTAKQAVDVLLQNDLSQGLAQSIAFTVAAVFAQFGLVTLAVKLGETALSQTSKRFGATAPQVAQCESVLSQVYQAAGDLPQARVHATKALQLAAGLGKNHPLAQQLAARLRTLGSGESGSAPSDVPAMDLNQPAMSNGMPLMELLQLRETLLQHQAALSANMAEGQDAGDGEDEDDSKDGPLAQCCYMIVGFIMLPLVLVGVILYLLFLPFKLCCCKQKVAADDKENALYHADSEDSIFKDDIDLEARLD